MKPITEIQKIILANAAGRENGDVMPLPGGIVLKGAALKTTFAGLEKRGLIERAGRGKAECLTIADDGRAAVHKSEQLTTAPSGNGAMTKQATIIALLGRPNGASLVNLTDSTGWQAHSVRAALSGLRKQGREVERTKSDDGVSIYRIAG